MMRLQKFIERSASGEQSGRVAYALKPDQLPHAKNGSTWEAIASFNAADEVLADPKLKDVFKAAITHGVAVVEKGPD